jgi:hypothetical protein
MKRLSEQERTRLANQFRREPEAQGIGSSFRIKQYVDARLAGKSPAKALEVAKR